MPRFRCIAALLMVASVVAHADRSSPSRSDPAPPSTDATPNGINFAELQRSYLVLRRDVMLSDRTKVVPGNSQITVYVSIDPRAMATLAAVSLEMNGAVVGAAQFSDRQRDALRRGASAMIYIGATTPGTDNLTATITGTREDARPFLKTASLVLPESTAPRVVEIELSHTQTKDVPDVNAPDRHRRRKHGNECNAVRLVTRLSDRCGDNDRSRSAIPFRAVCDISGSARAGPGGVDVAP